MASCKKKYSELRTNRKEKFSSPKKELSSDNNNVPSSDIDLMSKCNELEQKNKDLREQIESKKSTIHSELAKIQDSQLTSKEGRKRLEMETSALKSEVAKLRVENIQNYKLCNQNRIKEEKYYDNAENVNKIKKLRSAAENLTEKATNCRNEINQLMTVKESSLLNFKEKNQLKEDLESQIAELTKELQDKEVAIPNSLVAEQKFKEKKTEAQRTMKELLERESEMQQKRRLLNASRHKIDMELKILPVECKDVKRGVAEKDRQFAIWRIEAKMELNDKENELEDLKIQIRELKETEISQVLPLKESDRPAKRFTSRLRRQR